MFNFLKVRSVFSVGLIVFLTRVIVCADVATHPSIPLRHHLTVRFVVTETELGERAKDFGTPTQYAYIENQVRRILAQSGIDVTFRPDQVTWVDRYAYEGASTDTGTRTTSDLDWIFDNIPQPYYELDEGVISVVFCKRPPGWALRGFYQTNGYAFIGWNGVTFFLGDGMLEHNGNMDIVAAVLAHEIGHNFGLRHIASQFNLMNSTIYEGYIEDNQSDEIIANRFDVGLLAQIGTPDIKWLNQNNSQFSLHYLRSTSPIEFSSTTDITLGLWVPENATLEFGIFKTGTRSYNDSPIRIFRSRETATSESLPPGMESLINPISHRNPYKREGVACGSTGFPPSAGSKFDF